ncbi:MAG TPA: FHA domain-containing serine/threonine-protein kinase [Planctomycetota bacterium]|nr:FHA domain-containing serine/threonine-protein kinase [Planctomycetota bacterium]
MSEASERLWVDVVGGDRAPIELPRAGVLSVGSSRERADLVLEGQGVADVHCAIGRLKGGGWAIKDLGSQYGTMVNGERVQSVRLASGDLVLVGSRRLRIVDSERAPAAAPAPPAPIGAQADSAAASPAQAAAAEPTRAPSNSGSAGGAGAGPLVQGYRVERLLGRGGMGEVYLAVQESLQRRVALKRLSERLEADADFVRRFQAEARAAAALNHPNVVTVHDVWEEGGRHYLAMEYMDRGNLEARVAREGRLPWREVIDILHDAAKGLVYAEMRGIVHRDIKPANLMQNEVGTTKIADLGLATHLEAEAVESDDRKIYGTPHFISPEQARGERIDARSDLYSLGASAYRLLTGHTPFEGATTREILRGHFFDEPAPLEEEVEDLPPELVRIVHRLLRKKPDERYASAGVLLQEVDRLRSQSVHGIVPPQPAPPRRALPWRSLVGAAAVVLVVALGWKAYQAFDPGGLLDTLASGTRAPEAAPAPPPEWELPPLEPAADPERPADDDVVLKLRETAAELAYARLPREQSDEERLQALRKLALEHAGTTKAREIDGEARKLESRIQARSRTERAMAEAAQNSLALLGKAALDGSSPRPVGDALRAMLAVPLAPEIAASPEFAAARRAAFAQAVQAGLEAAQADWREVEASAARGDFDAAQARLESAQAALALPAMPEELGPEALPELTDLAVWRDTFATRLDALEGERARWLAERTRKDARAIAQGLGGAQGLEGQLRELDLEGARSRLAALESEVATDEAKAFVRALSSDLAAGQRALEVLGREYGRGNWMRKTVNDPRSRGRVNRDAVGADSSGVLLKVEGSPERVPWSAFGGKTLELNQLFFKRLSREYTLEEQAGIDALMRATAVVQAVDEASEMFYPGEVANLSDEEVRAMLDGFELARPWAEAAGTLAALERERAAAEILARALRSETDGSWSVCVAGLERLLGEFGETLLVRILSDGEVSSTASAEDAPSSVNGEVPTGPPGGDDDEEG